MNGRRVRLAWIGILGSFAICLGISLTIPLGIRSFIRQSTRSLIVEVQANQGTVGILHGENETGALFAGEPAQTLNPAGSILTNATDTALLLVTTPDGEQILARAQIYGNTSLVVDRATAPRFSSSSLPNSLALNLNSGRIRLTIPELGDDDLEVDLSFPQGKSILNEPGQYSITTSNAETHFAVLEGAADIKTEVEQKEVTGDERIVVSSDGALVGPLDSERNLIRNGNFGSGFDSWLILNTNLEFADQPPVELQIHDLEGVPSLNFRRLGIGHADSGVRQIVDEDVTDFDTLKLAVSMQVAEQSLGVCGEQGSECPLMVRLDYEDVNGVDQIYLQGFYAQGTAGPTTPDVCIACPPPLNEHYRLSMGQLSFYESTNLMEKLDQLGIPPRRIKSITLIASGHTFDTDVVDISLLADE